jgi:hypothetical protein
MASNDLLRDKLNSRVKNADYSLFSITEVDDFLDEAYAAFGYENVTLVTREDERWVVKYAHSLVLLVLATDRAKHARWKSFHTEANYASSAAELRKLYESLRGEIDYELSRRLPAS